MIRNRKTRAVFAAAVLAACPFVARAADSLEDFGDNRVMSELASRGLDSLLDRYFDVHKTPDAEQKAIKSLSALQELGDPTKRLSNSERERRVRQVVEGINTTLPNMKDPQQLAANAAVLLQYGVARDVNLLEYWGENPATQSRLRPVAETVYKMLDKAAKEAEDQANALANRINAQNQAVAGAKWDAMQKLSEQAKYAENRVAAYDVALSLPAKERAEFVKPALEYLTPLDDPDTQVQPFARLAIGKLNLVSGNYDDAIKALSSIYSEPDKITPAPDVGQQYEARYFENVAQMLSGKLDAARKGLDELIAWQQAKMPKDPETQKGVAAAAEMLRYRIDLAEAAAAKDPAAKKQAETAATNVLLKLSADRPELRPIIYQQLVERLPADAQVTGMDPLLLQGLMAKARGEANKPDGQTLDRNILQRGLAAAQEMARRNDPNITPAMKDDAVRLAPAIMEALDQKIEAAQAYVDYAKQNATVHPPQANDALDDGGRLVFSLRKTDPQDPQVSKLYDEFLPLAINPPFNKTQLAFAYAQRLRQRNQFVEALKYFRAVPKTDKNYNSAQYYAMLCVKDQLDAGKLAEAERLKIANELMTQAEKVRQTYAASTDPSGRERAAIATLTEAKVVGADLKKPQQTIQILADFEKTVAGTPDEKILLGDALLTRVNANMAAGNLQQATDMLVALLNTTGGAQGAEYVRGLLDRLDKDLDKAQANNDTKAMADIARSEASLSGFLVTWAANNKTPEIKKYTYQYMVFDARTKRLAGSLAQGPDHDKLLAEALAAYKRLQDPQYSKLWVGTLDPKKVADGSIDPAKGDPNVWLGIALTDFELKDYAESSKILGDLLNTGKLGGPTLVIRDASGNDEKVIDNDVYWEATYKLYQSNVNSSKGADDAQLAGTKQGLKNLLVRGGIPPKWADKFEAMRKEIVPDFNVAALTTTTQPVSSR